MKKSIPVQTFELAFAVPQVISSRLWRMSTMGLQPSRADLNELNQMWWEKAVAAGESWNEIIHETMDYQQKVMFSAAAFWFTPWLMPAAIMKAAIEHAPKSTERILQKAMAPIHSKAVANARRLNGDVSRRRRS